MPPLPVKVNGEGGGGINLNSNTTLCLNSITTSLTDIPVNTLTENRRMCS